MGFSFLLPLIILGEGAWLTVKLRAFYLLHPVRTVRLALNGEGTGKALLALTLALAGTLGVGNVVGVTLAIEVGGAGSLFWMVLSALFSSVIKYSEVRITAAHGSKSGMIGVLKRSFPRLGVALGTAYALTALLLSLTMGAALQASAIRESAVTIFGKLPPSLAIPLILLSFLLAMLGADAIKKAVAVIVPLAALLYTGLCLSVILPNVSQIPSILASSVSLAITPRGVGGGIIGFFTSEALTRGFSTGLLSNEAGAGTSSFSHTALPKADAARAGIFGIAEVLFDTVFLCTLTGVTVLIARADCSLGGVGAELLSRAFCAYAGSFADSLLLIAIIAFAVSTVLCWYYYGKICTDALLSSSRASHSAYTALYFASFTLGLLMKVRVLIPLTDFLLLCLTILTLAAITKNRKRLTREN